jgi:hypothetical protein
VPRRGFESDGRVAVAVRSGEDDDARFHASIISRVIPAEAGI